MDGLCGGVGSCPFVDRAEGDERTSCEDAQSKQVQPKSTDGPKVDDAAVMSKPCVPTAESMKITYRRSRARLSLHPRCGVVGFQDVLLNSFKHILNNSITPHGVKIECFFCAPTRTRCRRAEDKQRQIESGSPTFCLSLWLQTWLQLSLRLRPGLLLREFPQGTAGLRMEPALCPTATPEL